MTEMSSPSLAESSVVLRKGGSSSKSSYSGGSGTGSGYYNKTYNKTTYVYNSGGGYGYNNGGSYYSSNCRNVSYYNTSY